ncbi:hypothetical protein Fcan01_05076 [Folsomia candida]|uniref:Uncharacterized protein n=1 Tax=Folsomia candida TaxID=158441 RepID=A0A226EUJ6_FOLCA|nr:hypothetical protein Fcan01_05076 [Folsomia candida]
MYYNKEWVLRPLIAPTQPPPTQDPQLADGVNFQVPSRVVDKYLNEQKRLREKENKNKNRDKNDDHVGAFLEPYKIRHKKNKPSTSQQEESSEEETPVRYRNGLRNGLRQAAPPGPEIMYSRPSGLFPYEPRPHGILGQKVITYMDGISPIYEDAKVEDPTFPNFLLHAASNSDEEDSPTRYAVTRRPFQPEPTGHPDYVPDKKKYDGRDKDKNYTPPKLPTGEESAEGEVQSEEKQSSEKKSSEEEEEEDEDQRAKPGHFGYSNSSPTQISATTPTPNASSSTTPSSDGDGGEKSDESGEDEEEEDETSQEDQKKPAEEDIDLGDDDPARDVAGFMKLLFQGINNRISKPDKKTTDVLQDLLIK